MLGLAGCIRQGKKGEGSQNLDASFVPSPTSISLLENNKGRLLLTVLSKIFSISAMISEVSLGMSLIALRLSVTTKRRKRTKRSTRARAG